MLTVRMVGGPRDNAINVTLPMITASMRGGARLTAAMPMLTAAMRGTTNFFAVIEATLPMLTAVMTGAVGSVGRINAALPGLNATMHGGGTLRAELPMFAASMSGAMGLVGRLTVKLPTLTAKMTATQQAYAVLNAVLPALVAGPYGRITAVLPMLTASLTGHTVVTVTYEAYAVNLNHKPRRGVDPVDEVTRYTGYPFSQIVRYQGSYYGLGAGGVYLLGGTTDAGAAITWTFKTAMTDNDKPVKKTVLAARFGGRLGPAATVTLYAGESGSVPYAYSTPRDATPQNYRQKFGRGTKGRYHALGVSGTGVLALDTIDLEVDNLTRSI